MIIGCADGTLLNYDVEAKTTETLTAHQHTVRRARTQVAYANDVENTFSPLFTLYTLNVVFIIHNLIFVVCITGRSYLCGLS